MRGGLRYKLSPWSLGKLESLARSQFVIQPLTDQNLSLWRSRDQEHYEGIVQSVLASSAIEGVKVYVPDAAVQGAVENDLEEIPTSEEGEKRRLIGGDIYDAYIFALKRHESPVLSVEFIQSLHSKMFYRIDPAGAGHFKDQPVTIRGGPYLVETVPHERAQEFLTAIVERLNHRWAQSRKYAEYSLFLTIAEFIIDFLAIHPFQDGNGRTARLLSTYLLERADYHFARFYSLDNIIHETRREYYETLFVAQQNWFQKDEDLSEWIRYYVDCVHLQYRRALEVLTENELRKQRATVAEV